MTRAKRKTARAVYVLHIEYPDGAREHYVGSSKQERIRERLNDHKNSHAANLTKDAQRRGALIMLGAILQSGNYQWEHAVARSGFKAHLCMICKPREPSAVEEREQWTRERASKVASQRATESDCKPASSPSSTRADARPATRASGLDRADSGTASERWIDH